MNFFYGSLISSGVCEYVIFTLRLVGACSPLCFDLISFEFLIVAQLFMFFTAFSILLDVHKVLLVYYMYLFCIPFRKFYLFWRNKNDLIYTSRVPKNELKLHVEPNGEA